MIRPLFVALVFAATLGSGTQQVERRQLAEWQSVPAALPFRTGEKSVYEASFGIIRVGNGTVELNGLDTVRNRLTYRATMTVSGGPPLYKVRDSTVSWFDVRTMTSLRFVQHLREGGYKADRFFEIYPERAVYVKAGNPESPSVQEPLDDTSFLFFLRTVPLVVGKTYEFHRYFQPEGNPVVIKVLRKEVIKVPAGWFKTVVLQPMISAPGLFSKKEKAEVWISDDNVRMVVQIKSHVTFGSLKLALKKYTPGDVR